MLRFPDLFFYFLTCRFFSSRFSIFGEPLIPGKKEYLQKVNSASVLAGV